MASASPARSTRWIVRALLLLAAAASVGYALSDHPFYGSEAGFGRVQAFLALAAAGLALCAWLPPRPAANVLLLVASTAAVLGVTEIAGEMALGARYRPIYQPDARLIFKFIPGRCSVMTHTALNGGHTVRHCINAAGFRGAELHARSERPRVAVYGDSFIHAYYTPDAETFPAQLGTMLSGHAAGTVEVVNAGVSSYGPDQIALKMENELPWLRPQLAVVAIFAGNDYGDLMRNKIFRLGADGTLEPNAWRLDGKVREWMELSQRESILLRAPRQIRAGLRVSPEMYEKPMDFGFVLAEATREYRSFVVERDDTVTNTHLDYYSADVSATPAAESARYKVALMRAVLARIRDVAAQNRVTLAFLLIPHPMDVTDGYEWGRVDRARFPGYDARNQIRFLEDAARGLGVPYVSLYDLFRASEPEQLYLRGSDDHWNAAGQRLAARAMADYLRARGLWNAAAATPAAPGKGAP
jgi:lysophospholipase L1-like esterase